MRLINHVNVILQLEYVDMQPDIVACCIYHSQVHEILELQVDIKKLHVGVGKVCHHFYSQTFL